MGSLELSLWQAIPPSQRVIRHRNPCGSMVTRYLPAAYITVDTVSDKQFGRTSIQ